MDFLNFLQEQKRKLDEINNIINDNSITTHKTVKNVASSAAL